MSVALFLTAMTTQQFAPTFALTILLSALPVSAQELSPAIRMSAACAPVGTHASSNAPTIADTGSDQKKLYGAGEEVAINSGRKHGLEAGQRFFIRRSLKVRNAPRGQHTIGWLHIVKTTESSAIAAIDFSCDAVAVGDHLEPYVDAVLPPFVDRTDPTGTPDLSKPGIVLYGNDGRQMGGDRDFMLANAGENRGVEMGARYAVYHSSNKRGEPREPFGEAVVVSVFAESSLLRITEARDVVSGGDELFFRVGGGRLVAEWLREAAQQLALSEAEGSAPAPRSVDESVEVLHSVEFEDLSFDFDQYTLKADALALLDKAVQVLRENPTVRVEIDGYSCNIGTAKYNLELGARRANAVRDYLVEHGVNAGRMSTVSYGEDSPKYDNAHEDTRRLNRRAALVVSVQR